MPQDTIFLSIVIPAYNEERRLPQTLQQIQAYLHTLPYRAEIIVADDGSTDATAQIADYTPSVRLLRLAHRGKGFAVRSGALAAQGEVVMLCDADLAVPVSEWAKLIGYLEQGYDLVIGSREGVGARRQGEPWHRHVMGRIFNLIVRGVAVGGVQDTQCGLKALRRVVAADLFQHMRLYGDDAPLVHGAAVTAYDVELIYLGLRRGYRLAEVPVLWQYGTETKVDPLRDSLRNLRDVIRVRLNAWYGRYSLATPTIVCLEPKE